MEKIVFRVLIITSACSLSEKHMFFKERKTWHDAQEFCRRHYTELSPMNSLLEEQAFIRSVGNRSSGWIGLYRDAAASTDWRWSGAGSSSMGFFCLNLNIVEEKMSWEEAEEHCRESYTDLTSLLSETEIHLAQTEMWHYEINEPVWIGLRYLGDRWLWVNGDPLVYTAWFPDRGLECPKLKRCGALTEEGLWEDKDCLEKLKFICI